MNMFILALKARRHRSRPTWHVLLLGAWHLRECIFPARRREAVQGAFGIDMNDLAVVWCLRKKPSLNNMGLESSYTLNSRSQMEKNQISPPTFRGMIESS